MKKKLVLLVLAILQCNCTSNYDSYTKAHIEFARTEAIRIQAAPEVMGAIMASILKAFDENVPKYTSQSNSDIDKFLVFMQEQERMRTRMQLFQFMMPFVERILAQKSLELERPVTASDVLVEVSKNIPIIVTALSMYGLGATMADKVGNNISADLSSGSSISVSNSGTLSTAYSVPVEEAIPEEVVEDAVEPATEALRIK